MITTNGSKFLGYGKIKTGGAVVDLVDINGDDVATISGITNVYNQCSCRNTDSTASAGNMTGMIMVLGVGTTPASAADYCLAETKIDGVDINTFIKCLHPIGSETWSATQADNGSFVYSFSFVNDSDKTVAVTEIGLYFLHTGGKYLCGRCVIPARVVMPGENFTLSYNLNLAG